MTFGNRLAQLREDSGFHTRKSFAEKIGIPETTLRNYETDAREPGHTFLKQMSDFFKVSTDYLLGITEEKERRSTHQLKSSEFEHIKKYRSLTPAAQSHVDSVLDWEVEHRDQLQGAKDQLLQSQERITELEAQAATPDNIVPIAQEPVPDHLAVQAAHNDSIIDDEELSKMQRDMEMLKKYRK